MRPTLLRAISYWVLVTALGLGSHSVSGQDADGGTPASGTAQATLAGNALDLLPDTNKGTVEVIAAGAKDGTNIPVVVRNNSDETVFDVMVKAEARSQDGTLVGVGETSPGHAMKPNRLNPGEVAVGFVYIDGNIPAEAEFTYSVASSEDAGFLPGFNVDVHFGEVNWLGDRIVGELINPGPEPLGSVYLMVACISPEGVPVLADASGVLETVPPQTPVSFQMGGVFGDIALCENFLIAGTGHPE